MGQKNNKWNFSEYDFLWFFLTFIIMLIFKNSKKKKKKGERKSIKTQCGKNTETE